MSSTNKTTNIELSQYIGTDKPTYLNDYNGDMLKIDTAIGTDRADIVTAQSRADAAYSGMETNAGNITTLNSQMSAANTAIADTAGDVTTIQSLIGNGTPTTTDQTIIGAINELNSNLTVVETKIDNNITENIIVSSSTLRGVEKNGTVTMIINGEGSSDVYLVYTIPEAYRPTIAIRVPAIIDGTTKAIQINTNGKIEAIDNTGAGVASATHVYANASWSI